MCSRAARIFCAILKRQAHLAHYPPVSAPDSRSVRSSSSQAQAFKLDRLVGPVVSIGCSFVIFPSLRISASMKTSIRISSKEAWRKAHTFLNLHRWKGTQMNLSEIQPAVHSAKPALELISLAKLSPEMARRSLRALLLANPNHFGRISGNSFKAVLGIREDTTYEGLACVSYDPRSEQLKATIDIHRTSGFSMAGWLDGSVEPDGSVEYVRFYVSCDGGSSWRDQGLRAVKVFDAPGPKSIRHEVAVGIAPARTFSFMQNLPLVRAILSWNSPPPSDTPDWTPVWGNVVEAQVAETSFFPIGGPAAGANPHARDECACATGQDTAGGDPIARSTVVSHGRDRGAAAPPGRGLEPSFAGFRASAWDMEGSGTQIRKDIA